MTLFDDLVNDLLLLGRDHHAFVELLVLVVGAEGDFRVDVLEDIVVDVTH